MKLEPIAKPVRIRIKLGNTEHSSVDSVKGDFSIKELYPLFTDGRLERWLIQIGEIQLAEKASILSKQCGDGNIEDFVRLLSIFYNEIYQWIVEWNGQEKWSFKNFLSSAPLETIKIVYNNTKEIEDIVWTELIDSILSLDNVYAFFEDNQFHQLYDNCEEWGERFSKLAKSEENYKQIFSYLEKQTRRNPDYANILISFYYNEENLDYEWDNIFNKELSINYLSYLYENDCLKKINFQWGVLFANCVENWERDCGKIEEILKYDDHNRLLFYTCCYNNGISQAIWKLNPWYALANCNDYGTIVKALDKWDGIRNHYNRKDYNYDNIQSTLGKQILDFLHFLIELRGRTSAERYYENLISDSFLCDGKQVMICVRNRKPSPSGWLEFPIEEYPTLIEMRKKGVKLAEYALDNTKGYGRQLDYIDIAKHSVELIKEKLDNLRS